MIFFVVASGPSLEGFDFKSLKIPDSKIVAVNHAYKFCEPDYMVFRDREFLREAELNQEKLEQLPFQIYCHQNCRIKPAVNINLFAVAGRVGNDPKFLYGSELSGLCGISLAIALKASKIFLLGFDCRTGTKTHFSDDTENHRYKYGEMDENLKRKVHAFKMFTTWKGKIYNVCPDSRIDFFEKISFEEMKCVLAP